MREGYTFCKSKNILHNPADYVLPHTHRNYEVVYYADGEGRCAFGDVNIKYLPDTVAIVEPEVQHDEYAFSRTHVICCEFSTSIRFAGGMYFADASNAHNFKKLKGILEKINAIYESGLAEREELDKQMYEMLVLLSRIEEQSNRRVADYHNKIVNLVKTKIRHSFTSRINYTILAESVGYSYDRFRHIFKEIVGMSPEEYRMSIVINHAKEMLKTDTRVKEIAVKCGYKDISSFIKYFREKVGVTPREYTEIMRNKNKVGIYSISDREHYDNVIKVPDLPQKDIR